MADINQAIRNKRLAGDKVPILFFVDEMGILMRDPVIASHVSSEYKQSGISLQWGINRTEKYDITAMIHENSWRLTEIVITF